MQRIDATREERAQVKTLVRDGSEIAEIAEITGHPPEWVRRVVAGIAIGAAPLRRAFVEDVVA